MLKKFVISSQDISNELRTLIQIGDYKNAHLVAHSLKGESGNLGAQKISQFANTVEKNILNREISGIESNVLDLENSIDELSKKLKKIFDEDNSIKNSDTNISMNDIINDVLLSIDQKDPKIFDFIDELEERGVSEGELDEIKIALQEDETEKAKMLIEKLKEL